MKFVRSMLGMGDGIYQRPFVKALSEKERIVIDSPWPQFYEDLPNVTCVRPRATSLRTQQKNVDRYKWRYSVATPKHAPGAIRPGYREEGIFAGMRKAFECDPAPMDLPAKMLQPLPEHEARRYVVVRPVTVRSEWLAETRNPDPFHVYQASYAAREAGYTVISVADIEDGKEWYAPGPRPYHDHGYHSGELDVVRLMRLVANAAFVIGGIGWIVPAAIASGVPAWIICGGQGGYNSPWQLARGFEGTKAKVYFSIPDNFCMCTEKQHDCDKRISDHRSAFITFMERV